MINDLHIDGLPRVDKLKIAAIAFSVFMVTVRLISGVHWFTDIVGGVLLSDGLFKLYKAAVILALKTKSAENIECKACRLRVQNAC